MFSFIPKKKKQELQSGEIHIYSGGKNKEEISMGNGVWWRLALTRLANNASAPHGGTCFFPNCFLCNWRGLGMGRPGTATALVCAGGS